MGSEEVLVCRTRDISQKGCFLDVECPLEIGLSVSIAIMDIARGSAIELDGHVARCLPPDPNSDTCGVGIRFDKVPPEWGDIIDSYHRKREETQAVCGKRLRVLVVGDRAWQRGAMALYVASGWDVRFATDLASAHNALAGMALDAIIVEDDLALMRWQEVLTAARRIQPQARRIIRTPQISATPTSMYRDEPVLYHQIVKRDAGMEALLNAVLDAGTA